MKRIGIGSATAAGALMLAVGGGIIGGMMSSGTASAPPAPPAASAPVEVRTVVAEATKAPAKEATVSTPTLDPDPAPAEQPAQAADRATDEADRAATEADRASDAADRAEAASASPEPSPEPKTCAGHNPNPQAYVCDTETGEWTYQAEAFDPDATTCGGQKRTAKLESPGATLGCTTYADGSQRWENHGSLTPTTPTPSPVPVPAPQQPQQPE